MNLSSFAEKLKDKKYAVPVVVGSGAILAYAVLSGKFSGGGSSSMAGFADAQAAADKATAAQAGGGSSGGNGGGGSSDLLGVISALQENQQGFLTGLTDYINNFGQQVSAALGSQAAQTQATIDAQQSSLLDAISQIQAQQSQGSGSVLPDFSSFYQGVQQTMPPAIQQSAPKISLGNMSNFTGKIQQAGARTLAPVRNVSQNYLGGRPRINVNLQQSFNRLSGTKTVIPSTRGSITKTYNSPNIQSRGGFGGSKPVQKVASKVKVTR